ncbi:glycosyltransferase [Sporolactobacillus inulinus]|uniref:glycosyltransferase n=1 Tax=Sporolactobacillus inulinus TaxID=2078 RepID=UPI0011444352|nr:glycosyltransferase [Sporolactobacillus inulinus]GEB77847.1 glycosyl transferase family 1 [Sporolactobacillus inulinus]
MKILFLNNLLPFPLDNGGKIKVFNNIKALSVNHEVDLLTFVNNHNDINFLHELKNICGKVAVVEKKVIKNDSTKQFLKDYLLSLISSKPYTINKFYSRKMKKIIINEQLQNKYDLIYVSHLSMMVYSPFFKTKVILDQQNVESLIFSRFVRETRGLKRILGLIEYFKLRKFEKYKLIKADKIIALSENDKNQFMNLIGNKLNSVKEDIEVIPIHIQSEVVKKKEKITNNINLLFMGTMTWYPNYSGIIWFIKNVYGKLDKDKFNLFIVGGNPPLDIVQCGKTEKNIFVTGYVKDINDYISKCDISIVPLFVGSGQRVKIIESFAKGIPVVSTSIGAEGIKYSDGENILISNTKDEFVNNILYLSTHKSLKNSIINNARNTYEEYYSTESLVTKLDKLMGKVLYDHG